jgi:hypothetical protein
MSNGPVHKEQNFEDKPVEGKEEEDTRNATRISFRVKVNQLMFFKRMADHFYQEGYIAEPKFSLLAKACLNIVGNRYAKLEEITTANHMQKRLQQARGPNVVNYQQTRPPQEQAQTLKQEASSLIRPELRRASPVDKVKEPWWFV